MLVPVNAHAIGEQGIKPHHMPHTVPYNLRKIFPKVEGESWLSLEIYEKSHFGIGRIVKQEIQRMLRHTLLAPTFVLVERSKK